MRDTLHEELLPALAYAARRLRGEPTDANDARAAAAACDTCRTLVALWDTPAYARYRPPDLLKRLARRHADERTTFEAGQADETPGDPGQVEALLGLLITNLELLEDAAVSVLLEKEDVPVVRVRFEGPVRIREPLALGYGLTLRMTDASERWTVATHGGRIDESPEGVTLRLEGMREVPETQPLTEGLAGLANAAASHARLHAAASEEQGLDVATERQATLEALEALLAPWRGDPATALSVSAVAGQTLDDERETLESASIMADHNRDETPQLMLPRRPVASFHRVALRFTRHVCRAGGRIRLVTETGHDGAVISRAEVSGAVSAPPGSSERAAQQAYLDAMRWCVDDIAGGRFEGAAQDGLVVVTARWPDAVAADLDRWLPGWRTFSAHSQQMLRLLRGTPDALPEEVVLGGVLEDELEARLLPALRSPAARNLAHDLDPTPWREAARLEKVLTQVRKGKPKKEVTRPAHAAEGLWAYRGSARAREAAGVGGLDAAGVEALCEALTSLPSGARAALRLLARA